MTRTWLLFEDGSHYTVFCTPYPMPKGTSKPVDAYILTEPVGDFTIAAQKAVHAVFAAARKRNLTLAPVNAGFDLGERIGYEADIIGRSGGLSFAVAFAKQVLDRDPGNIAATGVIQANGKIGGVRGIQKKIDTAADLLEAADLLLFPRENMDEIPDQLMNRLKEKKINAIPVSHMDEVVDIILGEKKVPSPGSSNRLVLLVALLAMTLALAAWVFFHTPDDVPGIATDVPVQVIQKKVVTEAPESEPVKPPKAKVSAPPASPVAPPSVTPPLPPPGPEGDMGFE